MAIAKAGKIASSTANYGSTGGALDKNSANGFNAQYDKSVNSQPQLFSPSLNLGVSVRNTVAPTVAGYTNYTNGPGFGYGNLGYDTSWTEDNITIVTPDSIATNPNLGSHAGLSFNRYEISTTDFMRGAQSAIVIGSDLFTPNNYVSGGFDTPTVEFMTFGPYQTFIGKNNYKGMGANEVFGGYFQDVTNNTLIGSNNMNAAVDENGTFINTYTSEGANGYAAIQRLSANTLVGNNNFVGSITKRPDGYGFQLRSNTIIGSSNGTPADVGVKPRNVKTNSVEQYYKSSQDTYVIQKYNSLYGNTILGSNNLTIQNKNNNNFDGTYSDYPMTVFTTNILIGDSIGYGYRANWYAAGSGDQSGYSDSTKIRDNIIMGSNLKFSKKVSAELTVPTKDNVIMHAGGYASGGYFDMTSGKSNVFIGNTLGYNQSDDLGNQRWKSEFQRNVFLGSNTVKTHGSNGTGTMTQDSVVIGAGAQSGGAINLDNVIVIGADAQASVNSATNEITLGNSSISALRCNVTSITSLSDARDKANIEPISNASAFIKDLKPVKFDWNRRDGIKAKEHDIGFLAQDLDEAQSKHGIQEHLDIVYKSNPEALEASYGKLLPILVQALKEQQEEIEKLKSTTN